MPRAGAPFYPCEAERGVAAAAAALSRSVRAGHETYKKWERKAWNRGLSGEFYQLPTSPTSLIPQALEAWRRKKPVPGTKVSQACIVAKNDCTCVGLGWDWIG